MADAETTSVHVTEEDLAAVPNPSPEIGRWLRTAYEHGWLDDMVLALLQEGQCPNVQSALVYLQEISADTQSEVRFAVADFDGEPSSHRVGVLRRLLRGGINSRRDPHQWHGMIGHRFVNALFTGRLRSQPVTLAAGTTQLGLFGSDVTVVMKGVGDTVAKNNAMLYRRIVHLTRRIAPLLAHDWYGWGRRPRQYTALVRNLTELAGPYLSALRAVDVLEHGGELFPLSLLSWGSAVEAHWLHRRDRVLFTEVPVLHVRHGMSGGRMDALEVRGINGKRPNRRQLATLRHLARARERGENRLRSAGDILHAVMTLFGPRLDIVIYDWKFLIGDLWQRWAERALPSLEGPLPKFRKQMHRYLTLVPMDLALGRKPVELWHDPGELTLSAELWYFLPHLPVAVHSLTLTPNERHKLFRALARRRDGIQHAAEMRTHTNRVVGHLVRDVLGTNGHGNGGNGVSNGHAQQDGRAVQEALFDVAMLQPATARRMLEVESAMGREYLDPFGIIERLDDERQGEPRTRLILHYDRLLAHLGELRTGLFSPERGGFLCCLVHEERTPSLRVYLNDVRPSFHCYGCGAHGDIDTRTVPVEVAHVARGSWRHGAVALKTVDEDLHRILTVAQAALSRVFPGSAAAYYLHDERALGPDLAASLGAGYADERLIETLLDAGYTVEQMLHYGLLALVPSEFQAGIVPLLRKRGIPLGNHTVRAKSGETVPAVPVATLRNRVTFPLGVCGKLNNLYGRAVWPNCQKHAAHRKLTINGTHVRQGGWNLNVLASRNPTVYIAEGIMDALSLIQAGLPALAMIGVGNIAIVREVAHSQAACGMTLALALDWDKAGRDGAAKLTQALQEEHAPGEIVNFTEQFVAALPEGLCARHAATPCKDYNGLLVHHSMLAR